jgi:succinate dehydrogenase / fumarate reductase iron-sulfur subunit
MRLKLIVWRQAGPATDGRFVTYEATDVSPDMSFLEMLDVLNEELTLKGELPIAFDHDCREGICGRIVASGGYISVNTGGAQDANNILIAKELVDQSMDAAACIACGACVAACPNASASLFTAAKLTHLGLLPQGQPERFRRTLSMVAQMEEEEFGGCTLHGECQEACPKEISIDTIVRMNRDYIRANITKREEKAFAGDA